MEKQIKNAGDAEKIAKAFVKAVEDRAAALGCTDRFTIGYIESFLAHNADALTLLEMESRTRTIQQMNERDAA